MSCIHVWCQVSHVRCHMSPLASKKVRARELKFERRFTSSYMSHVFFVCFFGQCGEASCGRVCYQRGLPRLVLESYNNCHIMGIFYIYHFRRVKKIFIYIYTIFPTISLKIQLIKFSSLQKHSQTALAPFTTCPKHSGLQSALYLWLFSKLYCTH